MNADIDYKKILVPIDFSDGSRKAFYVSLKYAKLFQAQVVLLHVRERVSSPSAIEKSTEELEQLEEGIRRRLNELWQKGGLDEVDRRRVTFEIRGGKPWVEIVNFANESDTDLIIMGTHGTTGLKSILIGSQAERVVRRANCHVLSVKPDGFDSTLDGVPEKFRV
ncbi:MAG: universal stress protein A [Myxococcota bacterium]|jgi:universal stress protein A